MKREKENTTPENCIISRKKGTSVCRAYVRVVELPDEREREVRISR